jgi:hypothetical protein
MAAPIGRSATRSQHRDCSSGSMSGERAFCVDVPPRDRTTRAILGRGASGARLGSRRPAPTCAKTRPNPQMATPGRPPPRRAERRSARSPALSRGRQLLAQEPGSIELRSDLLREQFALDEIQGFMDRCKVGLSLHEILMAIRTRAVAVHGREPLAASGRRLARSSVMFIANKAAADRQPATRARHTRSLRLSWVLHRR